MIHILVACDDCWLVVGQRDGTEEGSGTFIVSLRARCSKVNVIIAL